MEAGMLVNTMLEVVINLLLCLIIITSSNLVVLQLIRVLRRSNHSQVVTQLLLLEVPLCEVLQLALGEAQVGGTCNGDLSAVASDHNIGLGQISGLSLNFDALIEVLLEGSNVKDLIVNWGGAVEDELDCGFLGRLSFCLEKD